ncbi:hypothetical protein BC830DRAFT_950929 [Chytriomyces sp. MP71]|nr:hypothetical protein BC830DRAFT_950929 [Chytriomyces sp. MP71]
MSSNPSTETSSKEVIKTTAEKDEEGPAVFSSSAPALIIWDQAETGVSPPTPPLRDLPTPIITLPTPDTNDLNSIDWDTPAVIEPAKRVGEGTSGAVNPPLLSLATIPAKLLPKQPPIPTTAAAVATVNMIMSKSSSNLTRGATLKKVVANPPVIKRDEHTRPASPTASNLRLKVHSTGTDSQERDGTSPASSPPPVRKSRGPSKSTAGSITSLNPGRVRASSALSLVSIHADQLLKNQDDDPQDSYEKVVPQYSQSIKVSAPFFSQLNNTSVLPGVMQSSVSIQPEERVSDTATPLPPGFVKSTRKRSSKKYAKSTSGGENTSQKNLTSDPGEKPGRIKVDNNELIQKSIENMKAYQMTEGGGGGLGLEIHDEGEPSLKEKFGVGVAAAIANAEALNGLASPHTLTFYEHEMESGYRDYFAIYYIPMWRKALVLILAVTWGVFIYHMLVYPR